MLQSTYRRAGHPVLFLFGTEREGKSLRAGMLIASAQLDPIEYDLFDPEFPDEPYVSVRLPRDLVDMPDDKFKANITLEVAS